MRYFIALLLFIPAAFTAEAQNDSAFVKKEILIILSSKNYAAAKKTAEEAARTLSLKLDLRGLVANKKTGLTYSKADCENEGGYPCYIARGRYDDGSYISIEYSSAFNGFSKGYYIVVAASGDKSITSPALANTKKYYPSAYVKQTDIYMGCMH